MIEITDVHIEVDGDQFQKLHDSAETVNDYKYCTTLCDMLEKLVTEVRDLKNRVESLESS